jgi:methyl coenzyme M reductase subunit C-like uncharacterized protein (methanogenesis marker protein 7)
MTLQEAAEKYASLNCDEMQGYVKSYKAFIAGAEYRQAEIDDLIKKIGKLTIENNQMRFGLELIINFDESSIYDDTGEIAKEYISKTLPRT